MFAHELGIDVWESIGRRRPSRSASCSSRPGPGVGGHCLPIDPSYLSWRVERALGKSFRFVELADDINSHMPDYVVHRLMMALQLARHAGQRAPASCCSASPTRRTPATRASRRPSGSPSCWSGWERRSGRPTRTWSRPPPIDRGRDPGRASPSRRSPRADAVVLLTDHDAFDYRQHRPRMRALSSTAVTTWPAITSKPYERSGHAMRLRRRGTAELHEGQAGHGRAGPARRRGHPRAHRPALRHGDERRVLRRPGHPPA